MPDQPIGIVKIIIVSSIVAYILGRFRITAKFLILSDFLKIQRSPNKFIWDDIIAADWPTKLIAHFEDKVIEGYPINIESFSRNPIVELGGYIITDSTGETIVDNRHSPTMACCIDLNNAEYVEVQYYKESELSSRLVRVCKNNL